MLKLLLLHPFNGLFSRISWITDLKVKLKVVAVAANSYIAFDDVIRGVHIDYCC